MHNRRASRPPDEDEDEDEDENDEDDEDEDEDDDEGDEDDDEDTVDEEPMSVVALMRSRSSARVASASSMPVRSMQSECFMSSASSSSASSSPPIMYSEISSGLDEECVEMLRTRDQSVRPAL